MRDYWKTIDTIVMGRKTYDIAVKSGRSAPYPGIKAYVFSHKKRKRAYEGIEFLTSDPGDFLRRLKRQKGKGICVLGGGELANALFEANVIDEIGFNIHPVLLGSGIPLFLPMKRQIKLKLLECKPFKNGCVLVTYRVKR
jgi:dihydrofolate reductase